MRSFAPPQEGKHVHRKLLLFAAVCLIAVAASGLKSAGYCNGNNGENVNPGTERMEPYYFPVVTGQGNHLQGYFDWRPKDIDEGVVAASSDDAGLNRKFH